jgi:hypothetical protein
MTGLDLLLQGRFLDATVYPFIHIMGADIFWSILLISVFGIMYIKTRNEMTIIACLFVVGGVGLGFLSPSLQLFFMILIALGITYAIYKLYRSRW